MRGGAIPIINGAPQGVTAAAAAQGGVYPSGAPVPATGVQAPLSGEHNTSAQVAGLVAIAALVIVLFNLGGFRFVVDAGIGKGR